MHHLTFSTLNFTCHFQSHHRVSCGIYNQFSTMHAVTFNIFFSRGPCRTYWCPASMVKTDILSCLFPISQGFFHHARTFCLNLWLVSLEPLMRLNLMLSTYMLSPFREYIHRLVYVFYIISVWFSLLFHCLFTDILI